MTDRLRVVISTHIGPPWGGVTTLYIDLFASSFAESLQLHYVDNHPGSSGFSHSGKFSPSNVASTMRYYADYLAALRRVRPQVVHIATAPGFSFLKQSVAVLLARMLRVSVVLAPHCSYSRLFPGDGLRGAYRNFVLRRCNGLIALSTEWLAVTQSLPDCLVEYLPNAINLKPFRDLPRPRPGTGRSDVNILFLGHIGREKGSFDLVEAAGQISRLALSVPWNISLTGDALLPGEPEEAQRLIEGLGLGERVHIRPPVFQADKVACLAEADIFVLPSYHEGMPVSLIEAMASGLPIVATTVGGIPDLVTDGETGLLVPPGHPPLLGDALVKLIEDPDQRIRMGLAGRQRALACHDLDARIPDLVRFHEKVAGCC